MCRVPGLYSGWRLNQPDDFSGREFCGALDTDQDPGTGSQDPAIFTQVTDSGYADEDCQIENMFLCQLRRSSL